jgi:MYXO-CTERM domain-containing protein
MVYVQPSLGSTVWYATAWSTATDDDVFATNADLFEGYLRFHAYALRPDWKYWYFGDTSDNKQSIELFSRWLVDMITNGIRSPLGQALSMEIRDHSRPWYDYSGADGWMQALSYDATRDATATPLSSLPTAEWLSRNVQDVAVFRSGWGPEDTSVWIVCGDYLSAHQHDESGSFQIFRRTILTGPTGSYDAYNSDHWQNYYSQHSVHANTLAVVQPGEFFPTLQSIADAAANVNDGGQRVLGLDRGGSTHQVPDLAAYRAKKDGGPFYETGSLEHFEHDGCHDYVACDVTAAYDSPGFTTNGNSAKVTEVTREFMFLPPDILLVFDRIEATDPSYDKRFLLHVMGLPEVGTDRYTFTNGAGRLQVQTLVPRVPVVDVVDRFEVEGVPHAPSATGAESGGMRLEISPAVEGARDYFLHLFRTTDASDTTWPTAEVTDSASQISVVVTVGTRTYSVGFRKEEEPGGHFTARDSASGATCDQYFGAGALPPPEDGGEVSPDGSEPPVDGGEPRPDAFEDVAPDADGDLDGGTDGGTPGDDSGGGCGCRTTDVPASAALLAFLVFALLLLRRRAP